MQAIASNNLALEKVDTDYALLLNPDAIISEESIDNLAKCAKKYPKIGLVGALDIKSLEPDKEKIDKVFKSGGNTYDLSKPLGGLSRKEFEALDDRERNMLLRRLTIYANQSATI